MNSTSSRLHVVDALRGFAIVSIMLLHNVEHFDLFYRPSGLPEWMNSIDRSITNILYFLFGGKSYEIFALLFGLTFFIQSNNQKHKGKDFRARFAWRLLLLLIFGIINSSFYEGDVLTLYAILGFSLIPVAKLKNKIVLVIAVALMLQPYEWFVLVKAILNPDLKAIDPRSWSYFSKSYAYLTGDSLFNLWTGNLTNGKLSVFYWSWEEGRVFQTVSLFMLGMLAGRKSLFALSDKNKVLWIRLLIIASLLFIPLFIFRNTVISDIANAAIRRPARAIVASWSNFAFMMVLVSGFVLLFQARYFHSILNVFSSFGRMSLSNYMIQSILGSFIYYGFGLGLYQYTGATYCLFIGIALAVFQGFFSSWWMKRHKQGPFEIIWHKTTWIGYNS